MKKIDEYYNYHYNKAFYIMTIVHSLVLAQNSNMQQPDNFQHWKSQLIRMAKTYNPDPVQIKSDAFQIEDLSTDLSLGQSRKLSQNILKELSQAFQDEEIISSIFDLPEEGPEREKFMESLGFASSVLHFTYESHIGLGGTISLQAHDIKGLLQKIESGQKLPANYSGIQEIFKLIKIVPHPDFSASKDSMNRMALANLGEFLLPGFDFTDSTHEIPPSQIIAEGDVSSRSMQTPSEVFLGETSPVTPVDNINQREITIPGYVADQYIPTALSFLTLPAVSREIQNRFFKRPPSTRMVFKPTQSRYGLGSNMLPKISSGLGVLGIFLMIYDLHKNGMQSFIDYTEIAETSSNLPLKATY